MKAIPSLWKRVSEPSHERAPAMLSSGYLPSLDGWRAFSIFLVILSHCMITSPHAYFSNGQFGVNIFFAISGFLITTLLLKEQSTTGAISLRNFYTRRFLRIFPVAYLYLIVLMVLNAVFYLHITTSSFLTGFLYLKNFSRLHASEWQSGHFWTLAIEEQFYLTFPFILRYSYKAYVRIVVLLLVAIPLINEFGFHSSHPGIVTTLIDAVGSGTANILWGSLFSILVFKGLITQTQLVKYKHLGVVLFLFILFIGFRGVADFRGKETLRLYLFGPATCLLLLLSMQPGTVLYAILNNRWVRQAGILSYSIYIWQQLFTAHQPWENAFKYGNALWWNLPAALVVASLSYYLFERKFLRLKEHFISKPPRSTGVDRTSSPITERKTTAEIVAPKAISSYESHSIPMEKS